MTRSHPTRDQGFSLIELLAVLAIVGLLSAIAIPITLSQRNTSVESTQQSDLLRVSTSLTATLNGWRGTPPAEVAIATSGNTWTATPAGRAAAASGTLSAGSALTGTIWTDGSYCLTNTGTTGAIFTLRSDTNTIQQSSPCPSAALGGAGAVTTASATADVPTTVNGVNVYSPIDHQLSLTWNDLEGATSYIVNATGVDPVTVTGTAVTIPGLAVGPNLVTIYAKNINGTGPGLNVNATVSDYAANTAVKVPKWVDMPLTGGWVSYNSTQASSGGYVLPQYTKSNGIVQVRGLINAGTLTAGTVIATLPVGYRPDYALRIPTNNNGASRTLNVSTAGVITLGTGFTVAWTNLDNILFPAAGTATWTNLGTAGQAFANSWNSVGGIYGPARYWKDKEGLVWLGGAVTGGTTTDNTVIAALPAEVLPALYQHFTVTAATLNGDNYGGVGIHATNGLVIKPNTPNGFVSLDGVLYVGPPDPTSFENLEWHNMAVMGNGFTRYSATYPDIGYAQTSYGLVVLAGLGAKNAGTYGSNTIWFIPDIMRPTMRTMKATNSGQLLGRLDIDGYGKVMYYTGTGTWAAFDGVAYFPG